MGLFTRLTGKNPAKKATDDVLLFHAMILMAAADGVLEDSECAAVEAFFVALPEFRGHQFRNLLDESNKLSSKYETTSASVAELAGIESDAIRKKAFVLAVDIALASGEVGEAEDAMLDAMQHTLQIDDALAKQVIEVLSLKYAS